MKHHRSIRLLDYDYTRPGVYFVTVVTYQRECLFGDVISGKIVLSEWGSLAKNEWLRLGQRFEQVSIDEFIIMPNHIHGILSIVVGAGQENMMNYGELNLSSPSSVGAGQEITILSGESNLAPPLLRGKSRLAPGSLGAIVGAFKSTTSRLINGLHHTPAAPIWQRNYYEHIVRDDNELTRIRAYIDANPATWQADQEYR